MARYFKYWSDLKHLLLRTCVRSRYFQQNRWENFYFVARSNRQEWHKPMTIERTGPLRMRRLIWACAACICLSTKPHVRKWKHMEHRFFSKYDIMESAAKKKGENLILFFFWFLQIIFGGPEKQLIKKKKP